MDKTQAEEKKIEHQVSDIIDEDRVFNFSDGVFAFAATLLVVKIDLPLIVRQQMTTNFGAAFALLWPQYLANIIAFLVIGYYWLNHHAIFALIRRFNARVVWLNIVFLICLSFIPFPVDLYGDFPRVPLVVVFFSASLALVGYMQAILWWYASSNHRLVAKDLGNKQINYYLARNLVAPIVFTLSIPLVYIHPLLTQASWVFVILGIFLINKHFKLKSSNEIEKAEA